MKKLTFRLSEETHEKLTNGCREAHVTIQNALEAFADLYTPGDYPVVTERAFLLRQDRVASYSASRIGAIPTPHSGGRNAKS